MNELGFPDICQCSRQDLLERCVYWLKTLLNQLQQVQIQLQQAQIQLQQTEQRVVAMETSKFWRMRQTWFKFKEIIGLRSFE